MSGFYLNKTDGKFMGVCAGLADWMGVDALWVRVAAVLLTVLGAHVIVPAYLVIGFLANRRPSMIGDDAAEERWLDRQWRRRERHAARSDLSELDQRLSAMERNLRG